MSLLILYYDFFCTLSVLLLLASLNIETFFDDVDDAERLKMYTAEVATRMSAMQWVIFAYVAGIHLAVSRVAYILYFFCFVWHKLSARVLFEFDIVNRKCNLCENLSFYQLYIAKLWSNLCHTIHVQTPSISIVLYSIEYVYLGKW